MRAARPSAQARPTQSRRAAEVLTRAAVVICALLAGLLARATPTRRQRVIAWTLAVLAAIDCVRPLVRRWPPLDMAGLLAWYAVTAAGVWSVLRGDHLKGFDFRRLWIAIAAVAVVLALLASSVLALRYHATPQLAGLAFGLALAVELYAVTRYSLRWEQPDAARGVALVLVCSSLADLAGPWALRQPVRDWWIGRAVALATWGVVAIVQAWALVRGRVGDREA